MFTLLKPAAQPAQALVILLISYKCLASGLSFVELIAENFTNYCSECGGASSQLGKAKQALLARVFDLILTQAWLMTTFSLRLPQMRPRTVKIKRGHSLKF